MAKKRFINVYFPHGGENRRVGYAQNQPPYYSARMENVRSVGSLERRKRGGTRPGMEKYVDNLFGANITGLQKVTYLDDDEALQNDLAVIADGALHIVQGSAIEEATAYLTDESGNNIIDESGNNIIFTSTVASVNPLGDTDAFQMAEKDGRLYIADSTLKEYNPRTGVVRVVDNAPASQPLVCVYQERLVVSGSDHIFYMSKQDDVDDWSFAGDIGDVGQAVAGHVGDEGMVGEAVNSIIGWRDEVLLLGTNSTLWAIYGNPAGGGEKKCVSPFVGILSPRAICVTPDGLVLFLSRDGVYSWQIGSSKHPAPFSERRVPEALVNVDPTDTHVQMVYDHRNRGIHLFTTSI